MTTILMTIATLRKKQNMDGLRPRHDRNNYGTQRGLELSRRHATDVNER